MLLFYPNLLTAQNYLPGQIIVDLDHQEWLKYYGCGSFFMCGPGYPEEFLYRDTRNPDGIRNGEQ